MRIGVERALGVETHKFEQFLGAAGAATLGELLHLRFDEHRRVQARKCVLINHRDFAAAQFVHLLVGEGKQILAVVEDLARDLRLLVEQAHDGEARDGLAAAGFAHKTHGLARADDEAHVVDDVHVAMTRELDAEVLHFEDRRHIGAGGEAVGAHKLDLAQCVEALGEHFGLGGVGERRVGDHAVGLAVALKIILVDLNGGLRGGDRVGDALGDDVQAEHRDHDHKAREQRLPPAAGEHAVARVGEDVAPRRRRLGDAGRDEGKRCLEHDGVGDEHDGEHEHRGDAVAHDVLPEDPGGASTGDNDGAHIILVVLAHHVRAHDAGDLRDVEKADSENKRGYAVAEYDDEGCGERDAREGHDDVQDAHDDV